MIRFHSSLLPFTLLLAGATSLPAFAARDVSPRIEARQEQYAKDQASSLIRFNGRLLCPMADVNNGQACNIRFEDLKSGKTFNLTNAGDAMRLYHSGAKTVAIDGSIQDEETIHVARIEASSN